jgi:hypothetical protein
MGFAGELDQKHHNHLRHLVLRIVHRGREMICWIYY